jgi:hypothetical protein
MAHQFGPSADSMFSSEYFYYLSNDKRPPCDKYCYQSITDVKAYKSIFKERTNNDIKN